jgi:hypothetical protein
MVPILDGSHIQLLEQRTTGILYKLGTGQYWQAMGETIDTATIQHLLGHVGSLKRNQA